MRVHFLFVLLPHNPALLIISVSQDKTMKILFAILISFICLSCMMTGRKYINTIDCAYYTTDSNPYKSELQPRGKCAFEREGRIYVCDSTLKSLQFTEKGLASIFTKQYGWLFVKRDGSTISTITFDNGPDYFIEHLARYRAGKKIGFIDEFGRIVIKAQYDFAFPFKGKNAIVCNGCKEISEGEHKSLSGGTWGCIDKKGNIVLPIRYSQDEIRTKLKQN
jgi:hypothetical protein